MADYETHVLTTAAVYFVQGILGLSRLAMSFFLKDELHIGPAEVGAANCSCCVLPVVVSHSQGGWPAQYSQEAQQPGSFTTMQPWVCSNVAVVCLHQHHLCCPCTAVLYFTGSSVDRRGGAAMDGQTPVRLHF